jgi:hypothetical protein
MEMETNEDFDPIWAEVCSMFAYYANWEQEQEEQAQPAQ